LTRPSASALRSELAVLAAYTVTTIAMTWPLVLRLGSAVPGDPADPGDYWAYYWDLWWVKKALLERHTSPYFTPYVHHPAGSVLYFHSLMLFPSLLALPVVTTLGLTAAYNFVVFLAFVGSGYGAYRLALEVLGTVDAPEGRAFVARGAAFLGGLVFTFNGYHFARLLGHLDLASYQWLPFYALFLLRAARRDGWRDPLLAAAFFAATALTNWYYAAFLGLFTLLVVARIALEPGIGRWRSAARVLAAPLLAAVVLAPVLWPMLDLGRRMGGVPDIADDVRRYSADLLAFVVPTPLHSLWGKAIGGFYPLLEGDKGNLAESAAYLGIAPLLLVAAGLRTAWRAQRFWLVGFALFTVLALGPELRVGGHVVGIGGRPLPLPYTLLMRLPYGELAHAPSRFAVMSALCFSVLAAAAAAAAMTRIASTRKRAAFFGIAIAAVLVENAAVPYPLAPVAVPPAYDHIAAAPRDANAGAVLEVPIPDNPALYPQRMLYQTRHERPSFGGYLSRGLPPVPFQALPGFRELKTLSLDARDIVAEPADPSRAGRAALRLFGASHVVLLKPDFADAKAVAHAEVVAAALFGGAPPLFDDAQARVYAVPQGEGAAFLWLEEGWFDLESEASAQAGGPPELWRWTGEVARIGLGTPSAGDWVLELRGWSTSQPRRIEVLLDGRSETVIVVNPEAGSYRVGVTASAGLHTFELKSLDGVEVAGASDPRRISVAWSEVRLVPASR
jgi:hypothetical protein